MPKTKDTAATVAKWKRVTPQRTEEYLEGVQNPRTDWATATAASETNWKTAIAAASTAGRFGKGVAKAGSAKWKEKTIAKGRDRWGAGVAIGDTAYAEGVGPYLAVINATDVGPRFAAGDPRNIDRVRKIADALHKKKLGV